MITFLDHAEDMGIIEFRVVGWADTITEDAIELLCWDYTDPEKERRAGDVNLKRFSIVKSAIKSVKIIENQG